MAEQNIRDRVHHHDGRIVEPGLASASATSSTPSASRDIARQVETCKINPRRRALIEPEGYRGAGSLDQCVQPRIEDSLPGSCAIRRDRKSAARPWTRARPRYRPATSVRPPGLPRMTLSGPTSATTSSEFGRIATPWINSSSDSSTKSCRLMKPRAGGLAVTTKESIAGVRIDEPVKEACLLQRHRDVGKRGVGDVSDRRQRLGRRLHRIGDGERPGHAVRQILAGKRGQLRSIEADSDRLPLSSGRTPTSAMTAPTWPRIFSTPIGFLKSKISHSVSARRNKAAGVGTGNENVRCRPSLSRLAVSGARETPDLSRAKVRAKEELSPGLRRRQPPVHSGTAARTFGLRWPAASSAPVRDW